uniref:CUB domain-containing protein n=1 Tax=Glossina brevipalpis TaxID=37001 RepID=A0A1A9X1K5_9MUSC
MKMNLPKLNDRNGDIMNIIKRDNNSKRSFQLRFQPHPAMPRLFWHKLKQKQEITTTEMEIVMVEPSTTLIPEQVTNTMPMEEIPSSSNDLPTLDVTTTTTMDPPFNSTIVTQQSPSILTTFTTIMRPTPGFPTKWTEKLKNLFFGSPGQIHLLHKHGDSKSKIKSKGFLSLFEVIKFDNIKCNVSMGDIRSMEGVCYHEFECKSFGGIATERCADGAGVCCIFLTGCGDTTNQQIAYFESPNYPQSVQEVLICVLIINLRKNVQQLRLDFLTFELNRPTDGDCLEDQFTVSGQNINFDIPTICGVNTGHHIYINTDSSPDGKIYLSFFAKVPLGARIFNIKISQLEARDNLAPDGCLQYYTEPEGIVKSFNYDTESAVVTNKEATYLNNLNYVICIKRSKNTCTVKYAVEHGVDIRGNGETMDFQIVNKDEDENDLVPDGQAGAGIFNCPYDFIAINQVRLCGERFNDGTDNEDFTMNALVRDVTAGPIILPFRSDNINVGIDVNADDNDDGGGGGVDDEVEDWNSLRRALYCKTMKQERTVARQLVDQRIFLFKFY